MRWSSAASTAARLEVAVDEAAGAVRAGLGGATADFVVAFISPHHESRYERLHALVRATLGDATLVGCSAGGVIGGGREFEEQPGLSLSAAVLPDVRCTSFHLDEPTLPPLAGQETPSFLLLPDPFTFDVDDLLHRLDASYPGATVIGGLASGGRAPGAHVLYLDHVVHPRGPGAVAVSGPDSTPTP